MVRHGSHLIVVGVVVWAMTAKACADEFPPGWLPIQRLDDTPTWAEFRKIDDKIHLYLPPGVKTVRGVFACFVFHSGDPRELARLWKFALVTVPWPFEYDLGHNDKRNGRYKLGHPMQNMGLLLRYLEVAAKETKHPELAVAPIVGWLMQNGNVFATDVWKRAPDRIIAWCDAFPNRLAKVPELTAQVPFAYAWEFTPHEENERIKLRAARLPELKDRLTPPPDFACRANTYGFPHGIYSKFNFFMAFLDRCIALRLPTETPPPGQPTKLKPIHIEDGWAGDYNEIGQWNTITPVKEAKGMVSPVWLPDEYAAWMWRSYHSARPDIHLTAPKLEYSKRGGRWGGPECGLGYGGYLKASEPHRFVADTKGNYVKVEFHDGHRIVGTAVQAPWQVDGIKLEPGLHALFAVGVRKDGTRQASRPAFVIVE
ncbi:MAG TPA: hypothetical protein VNK04_02055 [Gemmataceae bacterium]|nr:hypothetical protein [Gemmataceae bacterium]